MDHVGIYNVLDFAAKGDGTTDDTAAIQRVIDLLRGTGFKGGTVWFPPGRYVCAGELDLSSSGAIVFEGPVGPGSGSAYKPAAVLCYTGTGQRFINMGQTYGIAFRHLGFNYSSPLFQGHLFDCLPGGAGAAYCQWDHCLIYGWSSFGPYPQTASSLINLSGSNKMAIHDCYFGCAVAGVRGAPDLGLGFQTNAVLIDGCTFDSCTMGAIVNPEQSWTIIGNCFEATAVFGPGTGLARALYDNHAPGYNIQTGLVFMGNWCGDASSDLIEWINNGSSPWYGVLLSGNTFSGAPVSINLPAGGAGWSIHANNIASRQVDIVLPTAHAITGAIHDNRLGAPCPAIANLFRPHQGLRVSSNLINGVGPARELMPCYGHLILSHNANGKSPACSVLPAAGVGAKASINGSDTCGTFTIVTGTVPAAGNLAMLTYQESYQFNDNLVTGTPHVQLTPANAPAASLRVWPNMNSSFTSWWLNAIDTPIPATTYQWHYLVNG